jgi:hypothetical protein
MTEEPQAPQEEPDEGAADKPDEGELEQDRQQGETSEEPDEPAGDDEGDSGSAEEPAGEE